MPCYEPPPLFDDEIKADAYEAARLLCEEIKRSLNNNIIPEKKFLIWYIKHKKIDIKIATAGRNYKELKKAEKEIEQLEKIIKNQ